MHPEPVFGVYDSMKPIIALLAALVAGFAVITPTKAEDVAGQADDPLPAGAIMRFWRDPLISRRTKGASTYWIDRRESKDTAGSMTNQF